MTSPLLVLDTGVIYAVGDASDDYHGACHELLANFAGDLVVPTPVVVEAAWLIESRLGTNAEGQVLAFGNVWRATPAGPDG
jgi:uncharacterized protein